MTLKYDPDGWVSNPRGLENDLNEKDDDFEVKVLMFLKATRHNNRRHSDGISERMLSQNAKCRFSILNSLCWHKAAVGRLESEGPLLVHSGLR